MSHNDPSHISYYFYKEKKILALTTLSGLIYNVGMALAPWLEGQLTQCIADLAHGEIVPSILWRIALLYVLVMLIVQGARYFKRLYVRKFANHISLAMKEILYAHLLSRPPELPAEDSGAFMTKIIPDVDACVEGMRKFTTEIFDTGVVMISYTALLLYYDWRLTLLTSLFPPVAYFIAHRLKERVAKASLSAKLSGARLSSATMDRTANALTYRFYGVENVQNARYDLALSDYERKTITANLWNSVMGPLYEIIALIGVVLILFLGGRNVLGLGWTVWDIAAFSAYLSCFIRLAGKASHGAKLFNAVQKARVSWERIHPYLAWKETTSAHPPAASALTGEALSFTYPKSTSPIFENVSFRAEAGEIIGVTGPIAAGKSTLARLLLCLLPHKGRLTYGERLLSSSRDTNGLMSYMGHDPELFPGTMEDNVRLGKDGDLEAVLAAVDMEKEISEFPEGIHTRIGEGGRRLSGGQQARLALARTLYHKRPVMILDDPLAAVDRRTEEIVMKNLQAYRKDSIIFLISHRLTFFPSLSHVLWMDGNGHTLFSTHEELSQTVPLYRELWEKGIGIEDNR